MVDYLVLVALDSERDAFVSQLNAAGAAQDREAPADEPRYTLPVSGGRAAQIVLHSSDQAGRVAAALAAHDAITRLAPRMVLVLGVAGGMAERTTLGDVVVPDQIIDAAQRKVTDGSEMASAQVYRVSRRLLSVAKRLENAWASQLVVARPEGDGVPRVVWGPLASTDTVVANSEYFRSLQQSFRHLLGVDMESAGIAAAIERLSRRPELLVIRGVADRMDGTKTSNWREYASHAAAAFAVAFVQAERRTRQTPAEKGTDDASREADSPAAHPDATAAFDEAGSVGDGTSLAREMAGAACLNADDYAEALADVLNDARGEICFALMGHWGRGKTYLARLVTKHLPADYDHIWFSAWKYRSRPELWAYLHESFWRALKQTTWRRRIPRLFRGSLHRHGIVPLLIMLLSAAIAAIPLGSLARVAIAVVGVIGAIRAGILFFKQRTKIAATLSRYLAATRYNETLGLQAAIGDDLESLVVGWVGRLNWDRAKWCWGFLGYAFSVIALTAGIWWGFHPRNEPQIPYLRAFQWYPGPTLLWTIIGVLGVTAILMPIWLLSAGRNKRRLLLIVDDLDRMLPGEMLQVTESLKLFLEDSGVSDLIQLLMICEEESLREALGSKYAALIPQALTSVSDDESHLRSTSKRSRVIEENLQKLFVAHLRLPPLSTADQESLLWFFLGDDREGNKVPGELVSEARHSDPAPPKFSNENDTVIASTTEPEGTGTAHPIPEFTSDEKRALASGLAALASAGDRWASLGPRAILSYVLRYKFRTPDMPPKTLGESWYLRTWVRTKTCPLFRTGQMPTAPGTCCCWLLRIQTAESGTAIPVPALARRCGPKPVRFLGREEY